MTPSCTADVHTGDTRRRPAALYLFEFNRSCRLAERLVDWRTVTVVCLLPAAHVCCKATSRNTVRSRVCLHAPAHQTSRSKFPHVATAPGSAVSHRLSRTASINRFKTNKKKITPWFCVQARACESKACAVPKLIHVLQQIYWRHYCDPAARA